MGGTVRVGAAVSAAAVLSLVALLECESSSTVIGMCARNQVTHSRSHGRSRMDFTISLKDLIWLLLLAPHAERDCTKLCRCLITATAWNGTAQDARGGHRQKRREGDSCALY